MKVKQLIKKLKDCNQDSDLVIVDDVRDLEYSSEWVCDEVIVEQKLDHVLLIVDLDDFK